MSKSVGMPVLSGRKDLHVLRRSWHVLGGLLMVFLYQCHFVYSEAVATLGAVFLVFFVLEVGRKFSPVINRITLSVLGPFLRQEEQTKLTGTFLFLCGTLVAVVLYPRSLCCLAIMYLAVGDPVASIVGGQLELPMFRFSSGKSLHGTVAATLACALMTYYLLAGNYGVHMEPTVLWAFTVVGGLTGGSSELLATSLRVDDNITIPVLSGAVLWLMCLVCKIDADHIMLLSC